MVEDTEKEPIAAALRDQAHAPLQQIPHVRKAMRRGEKVCYFPRADATPCSEHGNRLQSAPGHAGDRLLAPGRGNAPPEELYFGEPAGAR